MNLNSQLHNICGSLKIKGNLNVDNMKSTLNIIIENNEGLRLRITEKDGQAVQYVHEFENEHIDFINFNNYENPHEEYEKWSQNLYKKKFELEDNQLFYFVIYKIYEEYGVLINIHHIISDGWSISLIEKQACEIYSKLMSNEKIYKYEYYSYLDFIKVEEEYLSSERFIKNKNFWENKFDNIPKEFLYKTFNSIEGRRLCFNIDSELSCRINKFTSDKKCSLNTFFIGILLIYINKITHKRDLVIGTSVFNRTSKQQKGMMGMFTSTVPIRFKLDTELNVNNLIKLINRELKLSLLNQKYPYDLLVKDLELSKLGYDSLFKMSVNYYNSKHINDLNGIEVEAMEHYCGNQSDSLQLIVNEMSEDSIILKFDYKIIEYKEQEIREMYQAMINIINKLINIDYLQGNHKNDEVLVKDIEIIGEEEKNQILYEFNDTYIEYQKDKTIHELFEDQVERSPDSIAVVFEDERLTYQELNERSNSLAIVLRNEGVKSDSIVGIMVDRSPQMIIGIMGILKAGGAYLPIDTSHPNDRIRYIIEDSGIKILLTDKHLVNKIEFDGVSINMQDDNIYLNDRDNLNNINTSKDLAYVIYTSGSTGLPKGVMINHNSLNNFGVGVFNKIDLLKYKNILCVTTIAFDIFVLESLVPLLKGMKIVIANESDQTNSLKLNEIIIKNNIEVLQITPSRLQLLMTSESFKESIEILKIIMVGGESLPKKLLMEINNYSNIKIYNMYGPTETTVWSTIGSLTENKEVSIGKPISNTGIYIINETNNLQPIGIGGELCIWGEGLARGYLNRPELTAEKFVDNPFKIGAKMYKTGDLARWLPDGNIEFLGRLDHQVKIRGFRIELGEIENNILTYEGIKETIVVDKDDETGFKYLCAYVVCENDIKVANIRDHLSTKLPEYMIPSYFVQLEKMPLTLNGKIDRKALPKSDERIGDGIEYEGARNEIEEKLVEIWKEILKVENIGINNNFFELGGHSLKATVLISKIRKELHVEVPLREIFSNKTIRELSTFIEEHINVSVNSIYYDNVILLKDVDKYLNMQEENLFIIHDISGDIGGYIELSSKLKSNIRCFGIKLDKEMIYNANNFTIEDLAERYIKIMKTIQPNGGYNIAGWSLGGVIAFEMVRQLEINESEIKNIFLIDSFINPRLIKFNTKLKRYISLDKEKENFIKYINNRALQEKISKKDTIDDKWSLLKNSLSKEYISEIKFKLPKKLIKSLQNFDDLELDELISAINIIRRLTTAFKFYRPKNKVKKQVVLYNAKEESNRNLKIWDNYVENHMIVKKVPGDHYTIVQYGNVNHIANSLNEIL
ncbi:amino acid adenylation domain-containing protein [Clostridium gasigenes]|nr:amino acid adenylation domain-containing protein [Clostridium gasigenes]